ncbi:MAG: maleylacetate reductase, partial [Burkholderiales bacterium]|nr:maleylacetate reductase [Burkholderiales bacterium]
APQAMARIARALGAAGDAPGAVQALARRHGAPTTLAAIGMPADGLDRAADLAASAPYPNPRPLERHALRALLQRAFDGSAPAA